MGELATTHFGHFAGQRSPVGPLVGFGLCRPILAYHDQQTCGHRAAIGLSLTMRLATVSGDGLAFSLGWALKKP